VTLAEGTGNTIMFSVKAAAKELGISLSLMYGLCAAGKIRHERHGLGRGTIRIPAEALLEYRRSSTVAQGGVGSVPPPPPPVTPPRPRLLHVRVKP
jgi:excisionase family DNA binding protein